MPYLDLPTGSYHKDGCHIIDQRSPGHVIPVEQFDVENGFYPKGECCYEPSAGDEVGNFINL